MDNAAMTMITEYQCPVCHHSFNVSSAGIGETGYVDKETKRIWFGAASRVEKICPVCWENDNFKIVELKEVKNEVVI